MHNLSLILTSCLLLMDFLSLKFSNNSKILSHVNYMESAHILGKIGRLDHASPLASFISKAQRTKRIELITQYSCLELKII